MARRWRAAWESMKAACKTVLGYVHSIVGLAPSAKHPCLQLCLHRHVLSCLLLYSSVVCSVVWCGDAGYRASILSAAAAARPAGCAFGSAGRQVGGASKCWPPRAMQRAWLRPCCYTVRSPCPVNRQALSFGTALWASPASAIATALQRELPSCLLPSAPVSHLQTWAPAGSPSR